MAKFLDLIMLMSLALCAVLLPLNAKAQKPTHPLSKDTVVKFLKGDVPAHRVAAIARERGIDFQVTADIESELRQAGATDELISTLREVAPKPAQIVVETSPGAQIYLDDTFKGEASPQGRLVIENAAAGRYNLRVSLAGKKDYEQQMTVVAGRTANIEARLENVGPGWQELPQWLLYAERKTPRNWKSREEYDAFSAMRDEKDANKRIWLADAFVQKFASSEFKYCGYVEEMQAFQQLNQPAKAMEAAQEALQVNPDSLGALAYLSFAFPLVFRTGAGEATSKLSRAESSAKRGLGVLDEFQKPYGVSDEQFTQEVKSLRSIFSNAIAFVASQRRE
jgi:hypothetical protein